MLKDAQIFKMLFNLIQLVFQLMLQIGVNIHQEFSIPVEEISTMISFWSAILLQLTKLRILGEQVGDKMDSLDLPLEILAVFATTYHHGSIDLKI